MNNHKETITELEQKYLMLQMLSFLDNICRKNNIKYSLCGGSLIGAVRHGGFIPWDDDVDIILTKENYTRLKDILNKETDRFQTLKEGDGGERIGFLKLIDTKTCLLEEGHSKMGSTYGVFIDIFSYNFAPNSIKKQKRQYFIIRRLRSILACADLDFQKKSLAKNIKVIIKKTLPLFIGYKNVRRIFDIIVSKYNEETTNYVISNWPAYGFEKEIQLKKNTEEYIDAEFEGLKVMIFKNYDEILRTTFGDYMQLPPESERIPKHNMKAWWREGCENEAKKLRNRMRKEEKDGKAKR